MNLVLFLCSGNYYRSRFAEVLLNWLAEQHGLAWPGERSPVVFAAIRLISARSHATLLMVWV